MHRTLTIVVALALLLASAPALAIHAGNHPASKINLLNRPPQAQQPDASSNDDDPGTSGVQVQPTAGGARTVEVTIEADDDNGHNDVQSAKVTVYKPDGTTVHDGIENEQASKSQGNGKRVTYAHDFEMNFYDPAGTYTIEVEVSDRKGSTDTATVTFTYESLAGVSTGSPTISLDEGSGSLEPEADTHDNPTNVSIENTGNVEMDLSFSGTDLTDGNGNTMEVSNVHLDTDGDEDFTTNEYQLATSTQTDDTFDLSASTDGTPATSFVLFAIHAPSPLPAGSYSGSITLEAVDGS